MKSFDAANEFKVFSNQINLIWIDESNSGNYWDAFNFLLDFIFIQRLINVEFILVSSEFSSNPLPNVVQIF